jgi:hypothetical protein
MSELLPIEETAEYKEEKTGFAYNSQLFFKKVNLKELT